MSTSTATVETLTAEVRVLMVGSRQVTLSVYKQLDHVQPSEMQMFGRVRTSRAKDLSVNCIELVGKSPSGTLVQALIDPPDWRDSCTADYLHWKSHRNGGSPGDGKYHRVFTDSPLEWRWPTRGLSCPVPLRRNDLTDDDAGLVQVSIENVAGYPDGTIVRARLHVGPNVSANRSMWAGWPREHMVYVEFPSCIGEITPYENVLVDAVVVHQSGIQGGVALRVDRLIDPTEDIAYCNKWLNAEHDYRRRHGEFCDLDALKASWLQDARTESHALRQQQQLYEAAQALPLIVLAGLR